MSCCTWRLNPTCVLWMRSGAVWQTGLYRARRRSVWWSSSHQTEELKMTFTRKHTMAVPMIWRSWIHKYCKSCQSTTTQYISVLYNNTTPLLFIYQEAMNLHQIFSTTHRSAPIFNQMASVKPPTLQSLAAGELQAKVPSNLQRTMAGVGMSSVQVPL